VIEIPAEPADPDLLPPLLKGYKAIPPFVTDLSLSLDDKWLYVSCWGTGELRCYDVSVPDRPKLTSMLRIGGIVRRAPHPKELNVPLNGGPQMVEISRDGKRVYFTTHCTRLGTSKFIRMEFVPGSTFAARGGTLGESSGAL
jgi:selenium-binding protein 1